MYIELFNETLEKLGEETTENILAALMKVNTLFLQSIDWDTEDLIDDDIVNEALAFSGYFLDKYGEQTIEQLEMAFNGECGIIDFTQLTIANTVKEKVLLKANENFSKKNEFDLKRLEKHILKLMDKYYDIVLNSMGNFKIENDTIAMSTDFQLIDYDESVEDVLKMCIYSENASLFLSCGDCETTMTVYGFKFENHNWKSMNTDELDEYITEEWLEEQEMFGYININLEEIVDKF